MEFHRLPACLVMLGVVVFATPALGAPSTVRVNVDSGGAQALDGSGDAFGPAISGDGRYVAFSSSASTLVMGDTNGVADIFVRDRRTGQTERVSVGPLGQPADGASFEPAISADGRVVAFRSEATNLVVADGNGVSDVFTFDRGIGTTARVSVAGDGTEGTGISATPAISGDGRRIAFESAAANLVSGDTDSTTDVFVRDLGVGTTRSVSVPDVASSLPRFDPAISADGRVVAFRTTAALAAGDANAQSDVYVADVGTLALTQGSVASGGGQTDGFAERPALSATGRYLVFDSPAPQFVTGDTNGVGDVFLRDLARNETGRISQDLDGNQGSGPSEAPSIDAAGRFVAFTSFAPNLAGGDTNSDWDAFLHDTDSGAMTMLSRDSSGGAADGRSGARSDFGLDDAPAISATGRFVAFGSTAADLVSGDTNALGDVFLRDGGNNAAPVAALAASSTGMTATFDGRASTDPDGWIVAYAYTFGDGTAATGVLGPHAYAAPGTYSVTLTVTDNDGASSTVGRVVTIAAAPTPVVNPPPSVPPPPKPPAPLIVKPAVAISPKTVRAGRDGAVTLKLACPPNVDRRCRGKLTLTLRRGRRRVTIGTGAFSLKPGRRTKVRVVLRRSARRLLSSKHRLTCRAQTAARDGAGRRAAVSRSVVVLRPNKRKKS